MYKFLFSIFLITVFACKQKEEPTKQPKKIIQDNFELKKIYEADQADRRSQDIDWFIVSKRDSLRRIRVHKLLDSNKVKTSKDYKNAAMVFQHGGDSTSYKMAVDLMKKSIEIDSTANKWLLAAATDRYLLSIGKPQIYGTQYQRKRGEPYKLGEIDTTIISDAERIEYGVETLAEQREKVKRLNRKNLVELLNNQKNIEKIIELIQEEKMKTNPDYDVSENGINNFGYILMGKEKNENALKVFKLNTILYPDAYNPYDSYGECLLKLGDKENAIIAYKKSLVLNPKNNNAKEVLEGLD